MRMTFLPLQGTKQNITAYVRGWMWALGPSSFCRKLLPAIIYKNLSLDSAELNSSRRAGWSKIATLRTALDGIGGGWLATASEAVVASIQSLKSWRRSFCSSKVLGRRASPSSRGPYLIKSCLVAVISRNSRPVRQLRNSGNLIGLGVAGNPLELNGF